jgi:plastocyanin
VETSLRLILLVAMTVVVGASCAGRGENTVAITDERTFDPVDLEVRAGQTVTWINDSGEAHSVTAVEAELPSGAEYFSSGGFSSESEARDHLSDTLVTEGEEFRWTFETPGTYDYYCIPHEQNGMVGTIEVLPAGK